MADAGIITIDVHGKTKAQARAALRAALIRCSASVYRIRVVHGFNLGTEIRDMVRGEFARAPRVLRVEAGLNPGVTELVLREY